MNAVKITEARKKWLLQALHRRRCPICKQPITNSTQKTPLRILNVGVAQAHIKCVKKIVDGEIEIIGDGGE